MAKRNKPEEKKGLDEWMATYSDMMTLLFCFFVLLYAASTPNETKFQYIFQSFNSRGEYVNPFVIEEIEEGTSNSDNNGNTDTPSNAGTGTTSSEEDGIGLPHNFDELFAWTVAAAQNSEYSSGIEVSQSSSSRINIRFNNSIMFEGNSAVLLDSGKKALREFMPGIKAVGDYIKNIRVQGHTAAGLSPINDWDLSSARACSVVKFMDFQVIVDSAKYIPEGRANYDPIADNDTEEGRKQNRRVELIIIRNDKAISDTAIIQDILRYDYGILQSDTTPTDRIEASGGITSDTVQQIISGLDDKYQDNKPYESEGNKDYIGPAYADPITEIPSDILLPEETTEETEEAEESEETE